MFYQIIIFANLSAVEYTVKPEQDGCMLHLKYM